MKKRIRTILIEDNSKTESLASESLNSECDKKEKRKTCKHVIQHQFKVFEKCSEVSDSKEESSEGSLTESQTSLANKQAIFNIKQQKKRKLKILVANDSSFQRLVTVNSFQKHPLIGHIDEAANGQEALELVKKTMQGHGCQPYDMILLDLEMPIMDGFTACKKIIQYIKLVKEEQTFKLNKTRCDLKKI